MESNKWIKNGVVTYLGCKVGHVTRKCDAWHVCKLKLASLSCLLDQNQVVTEVAGGNEV